MVYVKDRHEFMRELKINVTTAFSGVGYGGSAEVNYLRHQEIKRESTFVVAHLVVLRSKATVSYPEFTVDALARLKKNRIAEFLEAYGDQYCSEIIWGGELAMIYQFNAETISEQKALSMALKGSVGSTLSGAARVI